MRELLNGEGTEVDFSLWIQAALLFEHIIIPAKYYIPESLFEIAQIVIDEAKSNECKVERYQVNNEGKKVNVKIWDYRETISKITEWLDEEKGFKEKMRMKFLP